MMMSEDKDEMTNKNLTLIIVALLAIAAVFLAFKTNYRNEVSKFSETAGLGGPLYAVIVTYTNDGFSPKTVEIQNGVSVIFKNQSSKNLWVASGPHPTHNAYPEIDGCIGSTFDSCANIPPNVSWSFTFKNSGSWKYHDNLNPSQTGTVIVK